MCTTTIAKEPGDLSVDDFVTKYLAPNVPVLLDEQLTRTWRSRREWVLDGGEPNWDALVDLFGDAQVTATECPLPHTAAIAYDDDQQQRRTTSLRDYVEDWRGRAGTAAVGTRLWYLKDWHIQVDFPAYGAYETPALFRNDWINSFWDAEGVDDYRFCYMGPDGTSTPLHTDVFRSYSWSTNVCGRKEWVFVDPSQRDLLRHGSRAGVFKSNVDDRLEEDKKAFPRAHEIKTVRVIQEPGETIFVPSGWFHQGNTISINHNWGNEHNVKAMWAQLREDHRLVQQAIEDERQAMGEVEFAEHCQLMLRAQAGMDWGDFVRYLRHGLSTTVSPFAKTQVQDVIREVLSLVDAPILPDLHKSAYDLLTHVQS